MAGTADGFTYRLGPVLADLGVDHAAVATQLGEVSTGQPIVVVQLDKPGTASFARVTRAAIGRQVAIVYQGRVVNAPIIASTVSNGQLGLNASPPDAGVTQRLAAALNAG
jgi:preprotein translocase subunit SecD